MNIAFGILIFTILVFVLSFAAAGVALVREFFRVALARLMRMRIRRVALQAPERGAKLAARIFGSYPAALYAQSFAATGLLAGCALFSIYWFASPRLPAEVAAYFYLFFLFVVLVLAFFLRTNIHWQFTNLHPVGLYLYALEKLPGIPEHLQRQYLLKTLGAMRARHVHLFPRWLILARNIFPPGEFSGLLAAKMYAGTTDSSLPVAFDALIHHDQASTRQMLALMSQRQTLYLELNSRKFASFPIAAQLALAGKYAGNGYRAPARKKGKKTLRHTFSASANIMMKAPLLSPNMYSVNHANEGAPYRPSPKSLRAARARLAPQKPVRNAYAPVKEDLLSAAHLPIVPRILKELAETRGPEILPRLSRFRQTLKEVAQTGKRDDRALANAVEETTRVIEYLAEQHSPVLSSWPGVFCTESWRRGQLIEGPDYAFVVSPETGKADTLVGSITEVVGVIGAESAFFQDDEGRVFVSVWDEANKAARPAEFEQLEIRGGQPVHYDWALHAVAEDWENRNGRAFDRPVDLTGAPELDENSRRLLARFAEAAKG